MITIISLYVETADVLQDAPIYDLQRTLDKLPHVTASLYTYLGIGFSQVMGWATGRAWDYHIRLITIQSPLSPHPVSSNQQPASSIQQQVTSNPKSIVKEPAMLYLPTIQTGNGKCLTVVNGKTYNLIRAYQAGGCNGTFFFIVSGRTPLKPDDIAEHWIVTRQDSIYIARAARYFSYHLLKGEDATCPVNNWPKFKALPDYFTFVGPDLAAIKTQIASIVRQFVPKNTELIPHIINNAAWAIEQVTKGKPSACIVKTEDLQ